MDLMHLEGRKAALGRLYSLISFSVHLEKVATAAALEVIELPRTGGEVMALLWKLQGHS